ncbi:MAG: hypothetical protein ACKKMS_00055 [Candidatus Nealsonbacteria bacterium]
MGDKTDLEKEKLLEDVEELFIMGITRPAQILRVPAIAGRIAEPETAKKYLDIIRRRLRNRYKQVERDKILKKELRDLDFMERKLWLVYNSTTLANEKTGVMNSILKIKERRAKLLGFDIETFNISKAPKNIWALLAEENDKGPQKAD